MKKLFLILAFGLLASFAGATDRYYANAAAGGNTGVDCADAYIWSDSTHGWNQSSSQGGGNTVHLCGTINTTASTTAITVSSGGTLSGSTCTNVFTIQFENAAILQTTTFGGFAIEMGSQNCVTVQSVSGYTTAGQIQATTNGTSGGSCPGGTCAGASVSNGFDIDGSRITINGINCGPFYTRTSLTDETPNAINPTIGCLRGTLLNNDTLENMTVHDGQIGFYLSWGGSTNATTTIANNSFTVHNWGIALNPGGTTNYTSLYIYGNKFYDTSKWQDTGGGNDFHNNHIFMFGAGNCANCTLTSLYVYNNEFDGPIPAVTSEIQIFNDSAQFLQSSYFFNNTFSWASTDCGSGCGNGQMGLFAGQNVSLYNNSFIGNATSNSTQLGTCEGADQPQTGVVSENNIVTGCSIGTGFGPDGPPTFATLNYNLYANSAQLAWHGTNYSMPGSFSSYVSATGQEANSAYQSTNPLPLCNSNTDCSNVRPGSGSAAIGFGTNLYTTASCSSPVLPGLGALCYDKPSSIGPGSGSTVGNARPSSGAWTVGAYLTSSTYTITVSSIVGNGTVTSSDSVINCTTGTTGTCTDSTATGTITMTATPSSGYTFTSWGGGTCSGSSSTCNVTGAATVTATFTINPTVVAPCGTCMAKVEDEHIQITCDPSPTEGVSYYVNRTQRGCKNPAWFYLAGPISTPEYIDKGAKPGVWYDYVVQANLGREWSSLSNCVHARISD